MKNENVLACLMKESIISLILFGEQMPDIIIEKSVGEPSAYFLKCSRPLLRINSKVNMQRQQNSKWNLNYIILLSTVKEYEKEW